jgi:HEAT repeat protein
MNAVGKAQNPDDAILSALNSPSAADKRKAVYAILNERRTDLLVHLRDFALREKDEALALLATQACMMIETYPPIPRIDREIDRALWEKNGLGKITAKGWEYLAHHGKASIILKILEKLGKVPPREAVEFLDLCLANPHPMIRAKACPFALATFDPKVFTHLLTMLIDPDENVSIAAVKALDGIPALTLSTLFERALSLGDPEITKTAAHFLPLFACEEMEKWLLIYAEDEKSTVVRPKAQRALNKIEERKKREEEKRRREAAAAVGVATPSVAGNSVGAAGTRFPGSPATGSGFPGDAPFAFWQTPDGRIFQAVPYPYPLPNVGAFPKPIPAPSGATVAPDPMLSPGPQAIPPKTPGLASGTSPSLSSPAMPQAPGFPGIIPSPIPDPTSAVSPGPFRPAVPSSPSLAASPKASTVGKKSRFLVDEESVAMPTSPASPIANTANASSATKATNAAKDPVPPVSASNTPAPASAIRSSSQSLPGKESLSPSSPLATSLPSDPPLSSPAPENPAKLETKGTEFAPAAPKTPLVQTGPGSKAVSEQAPAAGEGSISGKPVAGSFPPLQGSSSHPHPTPPSHPPPPPVASMPISGQRSSESSPISGSSEIPKMVSSPSLAELEGSASPPLSPTPPPTLPPTAVTIDLSAAAKAASLSGNGLEPATKSSPTPPPASSPGKTKLATPAPAAPSKPESMSVGKSEGKPLQLAKSPIVDSVLSRYPSFISRNLGRLFQPASASSHLNNLRLSVEGLTAYLAFAFLQTYLFFCERTPRTDQVVNDCLKANLLGPGAVRFIHQFSMSVKGIPGNTAFFTFSLARAFTEAGEANPLMTLKEMYEFVTTPPEGYEESLEGAAEAFPELLMALKSIVFNRIVLRTKPGAREPFIDLSGPDPKPLEADPPSLELPAGELIILSRDGSEALGLFPFFTFNGQEILLEKPTAEMIDTLLERMELPALK